MGPDREEPFGNEKVLDRRAGSLPCSARKRMGLGQGINQPRVVKAFLAAAFGQTFTPDDNIFTTPRGINSSTPRSPVPASTGQSRPCTKSAGCFRTAEGWIVVPEGLDRHGVPRNSVGSLDEER
jgi:hypothetical protein